MVRILVFGSGLAIAIGFTLVTNIATAAVPVAVVEQLDPQVTDTRLFAVLEQGTEITVPPRATLVLGYLRSCLEETIVGGRVVIGTDQSRVQGGSVSRQHVECDGGRLQLTSEQRVHAGVMTFRNVPTHEVHLFGSSPILLLPSSDPLKIERVDIGASPIELTTDALPGGGEFVDLDRRAVVLAPGGTYRATQGPASVLLRIDPTAKAGPLPAMVRLVRLD